MNSAETPAVPDRRQRLADAVRDIFAEGIAVSEAVRHFIESSVSDAAPETVAEVLESPADFGAEPLMELIFFPEETHQLRLEPLLEGEHFDSEDIHPIAFLLSEPPLSARLRLAWTGTEWTLPVPEWVTTEFLRRLHIDWRGDAAVLSALDETLAPDTARKFRVMMRNARFQATERTRRFLIHFLERFSGPAADREEAFAFLLGVLPGVPADRALYAALFDRKRRAVRVLALARDTAVRRDKANMETLLMQGFRASHVDVPAVERELALLDALFYTIFDRAPAVAMAEAAVPETVNAGNLDAITERLTREDG